VPDPPATSIGILETGEPPPALLARFGRYADMFERMLGDGFSVTSYDVRQGRYPAMPEAHEAYLVTGSPAGVYEDHAWISELKLFLRECKGRARLVGICFGHQIMAEAFGGRVEKSGRGWGVGLQRYELLAAEPWMEEAAPFAIAVSHQDQVVAVPPDARVVAGNVFSPNGMLVYDDQPALSFQCHPEFDPAFAKALIESRRERLPDPDAAIASLNAPDDRTRVAGWIRAFLRGEAQAS
jgi:GMP synthase-like glutamine amidotransferase